MNAFIENETFNTSTAKPGLSSRFQPINSNRILSAVLDRGFNVQMARAVKKRETDLQPFAKHSAFLVSDNTYTDAGLGGLRPAVWYQNANDGTSSLRLSAGLLRLVCTNGLVAGAATIAVDFSHTSKIVRESLDAVFDGVRWAVSECDRAVEVASRWQQQALSVERQMEFAYKACLLRLDETDVVGTVLQRALEPRREIDNTPTLWNIYTRVQENLTKGGIALPRTANSLRNRSTRRLRDMHKMVSFNRSLWELAEQFES